MRAQEQSPPHDVIALGIAFAAAGLYFMLGAGGYLPMPEANAPSFIVFCAGAAFLFAGMTCVVRARAGMTDSQSEMPADAPRWAQVSYRMLGIGVAGALATIGTFVALGSGPRAFNITAANIEMQTGGEMIGRVVFGLGATIVWIYVVALTVSTVRKLFDRRS